MDFIILKLMLRLVKFFAGNGIDMDKLTIIAQTKVMMDRRRTPVSWKQRQQKEVKNPLAISLFMYAFFGVFVAVIIFASESLRVSMVIIHAYILFMMAMTLITDFSNVLLDTTDNQIILPRPVGSRTLFMARVVHILVYLLQFMIAMAIAPLLAIFIHYGPVTGIASLVTIMLTVAFAVFLTYLLYGLILRFGNEQKIKDIIGYFQIFMTVMFAAGYQVIPRLMDMHDGALLFNIHWYSFLLPPVWMAMTLEAIHDHLFDMTHIAMMVCCIALPVVTVWTLFKFLAPSFSRKLAALNTENAITQQTHAAGDVKASLPEKVSRIFCVSKAEAAGFEMTWKITGRDKNFKIQFYPSFAYLLIFAFVFVFKSSKDFETLWHDLPRTRSFLWFVYLPVFTMMSGLQIISFNDNFAAAWVYQSLPLYKPGEIISGSIKAMMVKFFLPVYLLFFAFAMFVWGVPVLDDFLLGFFNDLLIFFAIANLNEHYLPFSKQLNVKLQSGKFVKVLMQMILVAAMVGLHWLALKITWLPLALVPVSAMLFYWLLKRIQRLPWLKISV